MPFHPAPKLPRFLTDLRPLARGMYELERGPYRGHEMHYLDEGDRDGIPIVMVHGNPTWSYLWRKVIRELPDMRCIAPDLLGFGLSTRLPRVSDHTAEGHMGAVAELVEALELDRFVLVGQDWGGPIAMGVGTRLPDRVRGFVLANTSVLVPRHPRGTAFHRFARLPIVSDIAFRGLGLPQRMLWLVQGDRRSIRGEVERAYRWPLQKFSDRAGPLALARMVPASPDHPAIPALMEASQWARKFEGPKALVWGMNDPILGRAIRKHQDAFPEAPVTLTEAGHFLQEEVPEAIAAAIRDVVERSTSG